MNEALIGQTQLKKWSKCGQLNTLEQWLRDNGIKYFKNRKGEIVTTIAACNEALLGQKHEESAPNPPKSVPIDSMHIIDQLGATIEGYIQTDNDILGRAEPFSYLKTALMFCGVYFLIDNDEIKYVGKATNISSRLRAHFLNDKPFSKYSFIETTTPAIAEHIESYYIHRIMPELNIKIPITCEIVDEYLAKWKKKEAAE